jgi:hypothetical protein
VPNFDQPLIVWIYLAFTEMEILELSSMFGKWSFPMTIWGTKKIRPALIDGITWRRILLNQKEKIIS